LEILKFVEKFEFLGQFLNFWEIFLDFGIFGKIFGQI